MAVSLYLTDGSDTVNFLTGSLDLRAGGWNTEAVNDEFIWETFKLISDATDSTVRTAMVTLNKLLHRARVYAANELSSTAVWLYWNADGESAKRSLVLDGSVEIESDLIYSPLMGIDSIKVVLALKRKPFWENTSYTSDSSIGLSPTGGTWLIGNDSGSMAQRIPSMEFRAITNARTKYWAGIRPLYEGTTDFDPLWECEDGTNFLDSTDTADGGASGGNLVRIPFGTSTLLKRFQVNVGDVSPAGDSTHFFGKYLILCRCRVNAGATQVRLQLRAGFEYTTQSVATVVQDTIIDGQTTWNLIELGEVQFPPISNREDFIIDETIRMALTIWAERLSVSGSVDLDCFILIPSEHMVSGISSENSAGVGPSVFTNANGDKFAVGNTTSAWSAAEFSMPNWKYPLGGGIMVVAAEYPSGGHSLSGTLNVYLDLCPRWQTYRA